MRYVPYGAFDHVVAVAESAGTVWKLPDTMQSHLQFASIKEINEIDKDLWLSEDLGVTYIPAKSGLLY